MSNFKTVTLSQFTLSLSKGRALAAKISTLQAGGNKFHPIHQSTKLLNH